MLEKLKSYLADSAIFYSVLLIFVAVASFGLGRQSVLLSKPQNVIEKQGNIELYTPPAQQAAALASSTPPEVSKPAEPTIAAVVGSKSGTKYHLPTCPGAKQIKPENLVSFATIAAAEAAGYSPAANCPGLK